MRIRFPALAIAAGMWSSVLADPSASSHTIDELKAIARAEHPSLEAVEAGIEQAAGELRRARAYPNPGFEIAGGRGEPRDGGDARSESAFELVQPIERPGARKWRARLAEHGARAAELERAVVGSLVDATVARLGYTILGDRRRLDIARASTGVAERLHELLARRVELGESPPLDEVKARSEWFARRRDVLDAQAALEASRSALDVFCGGRLGQGFEIVAPADDALPDELPADLHERLREGNPVLAQARVAIEEADARIEAQKKEILPRIDLLARHENELDRSATSVGVGFAIPLWSRNRGAIEAAGASRRRASSEAARLLVDLESELARATAEYERALAALRLHREGWTAAAEQVVEIATFSFENGEASLLEVLDAQRAHLEVARAEAESWTALHLAQAEIERLIGGPLAATEVDDATR
jgi:cobalt-zinc-cadmium efflux system outer membrane protein